MKLNHKIVRELKPAAPFNFDATFHKPAHFPSGDNYWEKGVRWQTFRFGKENLGAVFKNKGTINKPLIIMEVYSNKVLSDNFIDKFLEEVRYRYNLNFDLTEFYKLNKQDKVLTSVINRIYGMRPGHQDSLYEYLIISIVLQNCTVKRSIQMMQILFEHYGTLLEYGGKKFWCFWEPGSLKNVSEGELRSLKLGYRAKFIKKIDEQFASGLMDEMKLRTMDLNIQMKELLKLYGVGPATVWYLLFDVFHQYDFFNHISPWEQKIYSKIYFNHDPEKPILIKKLIKYFDKFGRYKQLAVNYVWEDLWWRHKKKPISWLQKEVRM